MANSSVVETELNGLSDPTAQRVLKAAFKYILADIRYGQVVLGKAATNLSGGYFSAMTPSSANQEFTIAHSFGTIPYLLQQVLPLDQVGASIVRLTLSRAADANNVYLKSPDVSQTIFVYVEG